ncbi:hypothetical protein [Enhygromyxa salina]|uniref:hypothetical protein n=1 Tax=Enhygromyxa salina TaxID=215803 RepID=UPI0015E5A796|nr:hypothetical protein [Enhygromyxa salina]
MSPRTAEILEEAERRALAQVVRSHPDWTLEKLLSQLDGPRGEGLAKVTLAELRADPDVLLRFDGGPPINLRRLKRAKLATGAQFDGYVYRVLERAPGPVCGPYLRARVGGPRWKLQGALARLEAEGLVDHDGATSAMRYWLVEDRRRLTARARVRGRRRSVASRIAVAGTSRHTTRRSVTIWSWRCLGELSTALAFESAE